MEGPGQGPGSHKESPSSHTHLQPVHFGVDATHFCHLGLKEWDIFLQYLRSVASDLQGTKQLMKPSALSPSLPTTSGVSRALQGPHRWPRH